MKKSKILNILICLLLSFGIISAVAVFGFGLGKKEPTVIQKEALPQTESVFRKSITAELNANHPLINTGIDNIFYTADPKGNFEFYEFKNNKFTKTTAETASYTVKMSGQKITAKINYIERGGKLRGFGLYTSDGTEGEVHGYEYIFFKLTNETGKKLLLASTDKSTFYSPDKIYNEAFIISSNEGKIYFKQKYRTIGQNGISREDYTLFTEESLQESIFFTGRFYGIDDGRFDAMKKSGNETRILQNATDFYVCGNRFLRQDENKLLLIDKNGKVLHTFEGTLGKNLSRSGNFLTDKNGKLYNLKTDEEIKFKKAEMLDGFFTSVSPDGGKLLVFGIPTGDKNGNHRLILQDLKSGEQKVITEPCIFKPEYPFIEWIDNSKLLINIRPVETGGVETAVIDTEALARL